MSERGKGVAVEQSEEFRGQLIKLAASDPELAGRIVEQIKFHVTEWSPGREDKDLIKHVSVHSRAASWDVYRLKCKPEIGEWRIFFFWLDVRAARCVAALVEWVSNQQCYNDPKQQHALQTRIAINRAVTEGAILRLKR